MSPGQPRPAARRPRARKGEGALLRQEILDAAAAILAEWGEAEAVSIREVARRTGVSTPAIYLHFPDRQSLLREVCGAAFGDLQKRLDEAAQGGPDPLTALRRKGAAYVHFAVEHPEQYRFMMTGRPEDSHHPDPAELAGEGVFAGLVGSVEDCQRLGLVPAGDPVPVALALWCAGHGLASALISLPHLPWPELDQMIGMVMDMATAGIARSGETRGA